MGWDTLTKPTYRHELLPGYQAGRDFPPELTGQLDRLPELVESIGFMSAKEAGYEADDFLAAVVKARGRARTRDARPDERPRSLPARKQANDPPHAETRRQRAARVGPEEVRERYGVDPAQVADFIALRGDPSDRLPGAKGVGPQRAAALLQKQGTLEAALENGGFPDEAEQLRKYLQIARLQYDAPVSEIPDAEPNFLRGAELAARWGLKGIEERLRSLADG